VTRRRAGEKFEYTIGGAAWGGQARIDRVEVQIDNGAWMPATIDQRAGDAAWVLWSVPWHNPTPGEHVLVARAINARGEVQPTRDELRKRIVSNREDNAQWPRRVVVQA